MAKKTEFKVGDPVKAFLRHSSVGKVTVRGTIKKILADYGRKTYVITAGSVSDFPTRTVKKIK